MATLVAESTPVILDTHPSPPPQVPDQRHQDDHERARFINSKIMRKAMPMTMMKSLLPVGRLEDSHIGPMRTLLLGRHLLLPLHAHQTFSDCLIKMSLVTIIIFLSI